MVRLTLSLTLLVLFSFSLNATTFALSDSSKNSSLDATDTISGQFAVTKGKIGQTTDSVAYYSDTVVQWLSIEEAMELQAKSPKKIFMTIYATWCRWCRFMNDSIYTNKEIAHYLNTNYYPVKFNAEQKTPVKFKGRTYPFLNEGDLHVNEFTLFMLNYRQSYPGFVFINEEGNVVRVRTSSMDLRITETIINYYGSDAYRSMPMNEFEEEFIGKIH